MKYYQIILSVPDDFVPENATLDVKYKGGDVNLAGESFLTLYPSAVEHSCKCSNDNSSHECKGNGHCKGHCTEVNR